MKRIITLATLAVAVSVALQSCAGCSESGRRHILKEQEQKQKAIKKSKEFKISKYLLQSLLTERVILHENYDIFNLGDTIKGIHVTKRTPSAIRPNSDYIVIGKNGELLKQVNNKQLNTTNDGKERIR